LSLIRKDLLQARPQFRGRFRIEVIELGKKRESRQVFGRRETDVDAGIRPSNLQQFLESRWTARLEGALNAGLSDLGIRIVECEQIDGLEIQPQALRSSRVKTAHEARSGTSRQYREDFAESREVVALEDIQRVDFGLR
jgi:hypothetical protein